MTGKNEIAKIVVKDLSALSLLKQKFPFETKFFS